MKTYEIKDLLKSDLLIVELPEDTTFKAILGYIGAVADNSQDYHLSIHNACDYTLLGKRDEISEEDVVDIVQESKYMDWDGNSGYVDYRVYPDGLLSALESFWSALESVIYWVNPYQDRKEHEDLDEHLHNWQEAQSRTFDRKRSIILKKN